VRTEFSYILPAKVFAPKQLDQRLKPDGESTWTLLIGGKVPADVTQGVSRTFSTPPLAFERRGRGRAAQVENLLTTLRRALVRVITL
jgi:hypothetical protein